MTEYDLIIQQLRRRVAELMSENEKLQAELNMLKIEKNHEEAEEADTH